MSAAGITDGWEVRVRVEKLEGAALDWAYELARNNDPSDMMMTDEGLSIAISDDVNPPGWYYYAPRYQTAAEARELIRNRFGDEVRVPIKATRIKNPTYTRVKKP